MSVIASTKFYNLVPPGKSTRRADRTHDCLRTGIDHTDHIDRRDAVTDESGHIHLDLSGSAKAESPCTGIYDCL